MYLFLSEKKGLVLVITLWLVIIMSIFGIALTKIAFSSYRFAKFKADKFCSLSSMQRIVFNCKLNRLFDKTNNYDDLSELLADSQYQCGNLNIVYSLIDEERKININTADSAILKELPGMNADKAQEIVNSKRRPFCINEEIIQGGWIDKDEFAQIEDFITVHGNGLVNINTCSEDILAILGLKQSLISRIMDFRKGKDAQANTEDDGVFESLGEIVETIKEDSYLSLREEQDLNVLLSKNIFSVKSDNYQVKAEVFASNKLLDSYSVIIGRKKGSENIFEIKQWRQN